MSYSSRYVVLDGREWGKNASLLFFFCCCDWHMEYKDLAFWMHLIHLGVSVSFFPFITMIQDHFYEPVRAIQHLSGKWHFVLFIVCISCSKKHIPTRQANKSLIEDANSFCILLIVSDFPHFIVFGWISSINKDLSFCTLLIFYLMQANQMYIS